MQPSNDMQGGFCAFDVGTGKNHQRHTTSNPMTGSVIGQVECTEVAQNVLREITFANSE